MWEKLSRNQLSLKINFLCFLEVRCISLHLVVRGTAFSARRQEYNYEEGKSSVYLSPRHLIAL